MQPLFIILLALPLVLAAGGNQLSVQGTTKSIPLLYQRRANGVAVSAKFDLDCEAGADQSQFLVTITSDVPASAGSTASLSVNGVQVATSQVQGGAMIITGNLADLNEEETDKTCDDNGQLPQKCSLSRTGVVSIKQYFPVPNSINLHWLGQYNVQIECRLVPKNPESEDLIPPTPHTLTLEECIEVQHLLTIGPLDSLTPRQARSISGQKVIISTQPKENTRGIGFMPKKCVISSGGQQVTFIEDGQIITNPDLDVSGRSVGLFGDSFELTFGYVNLQGQHAAISCDIEYCIADKDREAEYKSKSFTRKCLAGDLPVGGNNRSGAPRSPSQRSTVKNVDFKLGKFVLINKLGVRCE